MELSSKEYIKENKSWEVQSCSVCLSSERKLRYEENLVNEISLIDQFWGHYPGNKERKFHSNIVECTSCSHMYASEYLSDDALEECYVKGEHDNTWNVDLKFIRMTFSSYFKDVKDFLVSKNSVLDIGCDVGLFLEACRNNDFNILEGFEPNKSAVKRMNEILFSSERIKVINSVYRTELIKNKVYDLISMIHVLDHMKKPEKLIQEVSESLSENGVIMAVVHDSSSVLARVFQESFPPYNLQHPQFFSKKSLSLFFEKNGYEVLEIKSTYNIYPLWHYLSFAPLIGVRLKKLIIKFMKLFRVANIPLKVKLGNIMVIAKKKS